MNIIELTEADYFSAKLESGDIWIGGTDDKSAYILHETDSGRWTLVSLNDGRSYLSPARSAMGAFGDDFADFEKAKIGTALTLTVK